MKKTLSILMSVLIIALSLVVFAGAAGCDCKTHTNAAEGCHCCMDCNNLDTSYYTSCIKESGDVNVRCCTECTGLIPCACGCKCCTLSNEELEELDRPDQILTPEQQGEVIGTFQKVLAKVREFFDNLFEAIFEFLRFDDIMGNN